MDKNIILRDGEIAVVIDNASIIMNVNTALEVIEKLNARNTKIDCADDALKNINKNSKPDNVCLNDNTKVTKPNERSVYFELFNDVPEIKTMSSVPGSVNKVPVVAFEFDKERAYKWNDLRAGVGKCIKRFDSMTEADFFYGVNPGTTSSVVNTWLPYMNYTGIMNPMIGDMKNYMFSSKYKGKSLRWSLYPYCNQYRSSDKVPGVKVKLKRVVLFRADAIPHFIKMRYPDTQFHLYKIHYEYYAALSRVIIKEDFKI